jgi:transcriptional regulator with GAF, ATPase, and Fis domain
VGSVPLQFFKVPENSRAQSSPVERIAGHISFPSSLRLSSGQENPLLTGKLLNELFSSDRITHHFLSVLNFIAAINSIRGLEALEHQLLASLMEVLSVDIGVLHLMGSEFDGSIAEYGINRIQPGAPICVSDAIIQQVVREKVAVLSRHAGKSGQTQTLICVPLAIFERIVGTVYLAVVNREAHFDEGQILLLTALSGIAAAALENARRFQSLENENKRLREEMALANEILGASPPIRAVLEFIAKVAPTNSTVLLCGESGTGKELVARAIHHNGSRSNQPFIAINSAALTESLLESELFGHEKGSFTGAIAQKPGKLELAHGGTLFLDEVSELALPLQAKLLRVLQERTFERVGGTRTLEADIRLIAATNRDLEAAIHDGLFRQDLYYRLNVVRLTLPPLRDRREDIALLAHHFAAKYGRICKRRIQGLAPEALQSLLNYDWPGNVRELENAIERAVVLGT